MTIVHYPFEPYDLSPLDHTAPIFLYVGQALCFRLSRPDEGVPVLRAAVARLASSLPFLTGIIAPSRPYTGKKGVTQVLPDPNISHPDQLLAIQHCPHLSLLENSTARENEKSYLGQILEDIIPAGIGQSDRHRVIYFQANVVSDGIILSIIFNHRAVDGPGIGTIIEALSVCCRTPDTTKLPDLPTTAEAECHTRKLIFAAGEAAYFNRGEEDKSQSAPALGSGDMAKFVNGSLVAMDYLFSNSKLEALKHRCNTLLGGSYFVSTDDILTAVIWACLAPFSSRVDEKGQQVCVFGRAVSTRARMDPPVSPKYVGNCVTLVKHTRSMTDLRYPNVGINADEGATELLHSLVGVARQLRSTLSTVNAEYVGQILADVMSAPDWDSMTIQAPDVAVSSLRGLDVYAQDFGPVLGRMDNFEVLPMVSGLCSCTIKPRRQVHQGWEVRMYLTAEAVARLRENQLFVSLLKD
ncbi:transferase family-domain-containing protein [Aspergillus ambiguus]|uniref:transferase family-domain-containing protein n=1 Tax=Aspergillus ambiguus TaxID=176160 RepID=UPI003CCD308E